MTRHVPTIIRTEVGETDQARRKRFAAHNIEMCHPCDKGAGLAREARTSRDEIPMCMTHGFQYDADWRRIHTKEMAV